METNCVLEEPVVDPAPPVEQAPDVEVQEAPEALGMKCYLHKDRESETACTLCGNLICNECDVLLGQHHICKKCLADAERVPAPLAAVPDVSQEPQTIQRRPSKFGHLAVPMILGGIMGVAAGSVRRHEGLAESMFLGCFAGFGALFVGWLLGNLVIPNTVIREKRGVLGALGVSDYGEALLYTVVFSVIFFLFTFG